MNFGQGAACFLSNSPAAVAQIIGTRLNLWQGQWYLDQFAGMPWLQQVIGFQSQSPDEVFRDEILGGPGVLGITAYSASFNGATRSWSVTATVDSLYGSNVGVSTEVSQF